MKSLLFALLLSVTLCSSLKVTFNGQPLVDSSSCDLSQGYYFFWLPADHTGFDEKTTFTLTLSKPNGNALCTILADSQKDDPLFKFVTCVLDVKQNPLVQGTVELPTTVDTSQLDFDFEGWETNVAPYAVLATGVDCVANSSGYLKIGALLLVGLLLL